VASQQNNSPVLYSYCNSSFIHDVRGGEFGLINAHLFDILPAISARKKSPIFFCLESGNAVNTGMVDLLKLFTSIHQTQCGLTLLT